MESLAATALLVTALVVPVVLFWFLKWRRHRSGVTAVAVAVATGWALNLAWAFAARRSAPALPSSTDTDPVAIAAAFGWVCPLVLVLATWLAWRVFKRRATRA